MSFCETIKSIIVPFVWIIEDSLWFVANPAYGLTRFAPPFIPWHKHWLLGMPTDYLVFILVSAALLVWSFGSPSPPGKKAIVSSTPQASP